MKKKGNVALYITFWIVATVIILLTAVLAPLGGRISSEFFLAGEGLLLDSNETISQIQDENVKSTLTRSFNEATQAAELNIQVSTDLYQYAWVFLLILTGIIVFLLSRQLVEVQRGGVF